jgi:hypothetical protein
MTDWVQFLTDHDVEWVTRGPNTRRGEVSVKCPWCGEDDPSQHLGISLSTDNWGCLRNMAHRGHSANYLIQGLLGCSSSQASLLSKQYNQADPETLDEVIATLGGKVEPPKPKQRVRLPVECQPISFTNHTKPYWVYLRSNRRFDDPTLVCQLYNLRCCTTGKYRGRIIIPAYKGRKLVGFQGRLIDARGYYDVVRYLSSSEELKQHVFNYDHASQGGDTLYITEGPFDALRLDFFGRDSGTARAVCTFGTSLTTNQITELNELSKKFRKTVLLFDADATAAKFSLIDWLPRAVVGQLPEGVKDPGDLTQRQLKELFNASKVS